MKAMIMAAGVGSRLMPLTQNIPKPMISMANRPLMLNIVELLKEHGFNDIIANLYYHAPIIQDYFGDGSLLGLSMTYSLEEKLMGTAGGVKKCEWFLDDTFVIVSGDALTDINLSYLLEEHKSKGALATIALKEVEEVEHFGVVITDENGKIEKFQEKPKAEEALSNMANTGIYIFEPEIFKHIPAGQFYDFGKQVFPHLVEIKAPFYGITIEDYWCDVGNLATYRKAHSDILEGKVKVRTKGKLITTEKASVLIDDNVRIDDNVKFNGNTVIGSGCRIESGTIINDSVIWNNTIIGRNSVLDQCIIGDNCKIGCANTINPNAVVASTSFLEDNIQIT